MEDVNGEVDQTLSTAGLDVATVEAGFQTGKADPYPVARRIEMGRASAQGTSMPDKPIAQLEGWQVLTLHDRPYQLVGFASDHPRLPGHRRWIQTSRVLSLSDDRTLAETVNTHYRLRHPIADMRFELAFPVFITLADLTAERVAKEHWRIRRGEELLGDGIPGYQIAILCILDLLDRQGS